jgi:hypothetical protein
MKKWAERLLCIGIILVVAGVVLRLAGYHQEEGFFQGILFLERGITPRAFLLGGAVCGIFSIACGVVDIAGKMPVPEPEDSDRDEL